MRQSFSKGLYAQITLKSDIATKQNVEVLNRVSHYFADGGSVYDFLIDMFPHEVAAEAESWAELASVGEFYENEYFEIEMMEEIL